LFDRVTAVRRLDASGGRSLFTAEIAQGWEGGRGAHGGYLGAILLRGLIGTVEDRERVPRSLTIHYTSPPAPGPVQVGTVMEREGRSLSTLSARMEQESTPVALALAVFSPPWSAPEFDEAPMPEVAPPDDTREVGTMRRFGAPPVTSHVVMQPRIGGMPFAGSGGPMELGGWIGLGDSRPIDVLSLALFSDLFAPAPFTRLAERMPSSTIQLTIYFRAPTPRAGDSDTRDLCLARFRSTLVREGFFEEDGAIWAQDGTLLAQSRQLAILMPLPSRENDESAKD